MSLPVCDRNIFYDQSGKSNYYLEITWRHQLKTVKNANEDASLAKTLMSNDTYKW